MVYTFNITALKNAGFHTEENMIEIIQLLKNAGILDDAGNIIHIPQKEELRATLNAGEKRFGEGATSGGLPITDTILKILQAHGTAQNTNKLC